MNLRAIYSDIHVQIGDPNHREKNEQQKHENVQSEPTHQKPILKEK